jgi:adenylate cyclase
MPEERTQRRLAAILAADVVGFSRLMEADEAGTMTALKARRRDVLDPLVSKHQGRVFKVTGDGVLVEFGSAVNAVQCAVDLQQAFSAANADLPDNHHIVLRIGVNLGDVMVEGSDLYGDGINIAARLEGVAEPGGILVSGTAYDHTRSKVKVGFEDLGAQVLKNIAEPVRAYRVTGTPVVAVSRPKPASGKPSVAVLPFANMSGDPEQEYFSDGISEDIITDLSKVAALVVISRNTAFSFKGKSLNLALVARQLNVRYVLEGSVRKAGGRVRITAQLIEGATDTHVWAERYDRTLDDIFALQDEIARAIVDALKIKLMPEERAGIGKRTTENVEAYQYYLMGRQHALRLGRRNYLSARRHYQRAIEIDPNYARAHAGFALVEGWLLITGEASASLAIVRLEADRALAMDPTIAEAHAADSIAHFHNRKFELAIAAGERAILLDPNLFEAHLSLGNALRMARKFDAASRVYDRATELDRNSYVALAMAVDCRNSLGDEVGARALAVEALARIEKAMILYPDDAAAYAHGCNALNYVGDRERALEWAARAITIDPEDYNSHYNVACFLATVGEIERAIDTLEHCVPQLLTSHLSWMAQDADMNPLRDHPRYQALIAREQARCAFKKEATEG